MATITLRKKALQAVSESADTEPESAPQPAASAPAATSVGLQGKVPMIVFASLGSVAVIFFLVLVVLQGLELAHYSAEPSLWLNR